jgi:hypothetical protein
MLNSVPNDILFYISEYLPLRAFFKFESCSIQLYNLLSNDDSYWRIRCIIDYQLDKPNNVIWKEFYFLNYTCIHHLLIFYEKVKTYSYDNPNAITFGLEGYHYSSNHLLKFKEVYNVCRLKFEKETSLFDFMNWFEKETSFVIVPRPHSKNKLYLSIIFQKCVSIREKLENEEHFSSVEEILNSSVVYPEYFMLHLFKIFYHCADKIDRETHIKPRIEYLESMLGLKKKD